MNSETQLKTLPSRNFVGGGIKLRLDQRDIISISSNRHQTSCVKKKHLFFFVSSQLRTIIRDQPNNPTEVQEWLRCNWDDLLRKNSRPKMQFYFRGNQVIPLLDGLKDLFFHFIGIVPVGALKLFRFLYNLFYYIFASSFSHYQMYFVRSAYLPLFVGTEAHRNTFVLKIVHY